MPTPSEQLLTRTVYATDGVTTNWDFSFSGGYLDKSHVKAFTEAVTGERTEIIVTEAMIVGPFQVRIAPALAAGLTLTVYRDTPKDLPLVDFTDESGFSEIALDTNAKQAVFIAAETTDTVNTSSSYDAEQAASQAAIASGEAQASATAAAAAALLAANEADASEVSAAASAASAVNSANSAASSSAAATAVFNANTTAYTRTLLDDATASAARATLGAAASGANTDITSLGAVAGVTAAPADNTTKLATTAFVIANAPVLPDASETVKGKVELATSAETLAGTDDTRAVHPAGLMSGFVKSLTTNGYQKLPSGLIIQWGSVAPASRSSEFDFGNITFPIAFPVACIGGYSTVNHNGAVPGAVDSFAAVTVSTSSINIKAGSSTVVTWAYGVFWIAIGY